MLKIGFYVPSEQLEQVKSAMFEAGAGRIGDYDRCAWQCKGLGQFKPLQGSRPFIGEQDQLEVIEEYRVEMVLERDLAAKVVAAMKAAHPYEEPAYDVVELFDI
ncbi:MAG: NGG1p interacting factor NIF3 [Agarilytica sp.]